MIAALIFIGRRRSQGAPFLRSLSFHGFCSAPIADSPPPGTDEDPTSRSSPGGRQQPRRQRDLELPETIWYMIFQRPWTTRLQNSIRTLCPAFEQPLVLGVLRCAAASGYHQDRALSFFRWVERVGFQHDPATCGAAIGLLSRALMLNHARCILLDEMPKRGIPREEGMVAALMEGYGVKGIPQEVVKLFRSMPALGVPRTSLSYDTFFKAILSSGRVFMAKRAFNAMVRDGVPPTVTTYNILLWGFCRSVRMATAARFFAGMSDHGVAPNIISYNTMLNGWVRAKRMDEAEKVFDEMPHAGFPPNCISYNIMIKGYMADGKVDNASRMFAEMGEKRIQRSERTYSAMLLGMCSSTEKSAEACKLLVEMADRKLLPKDNSVFKALLSYLCASGDLDSAMGAHRTMRNFPDVMDLSHYSVLIESLCKGGRYEDAVDVMDELLVKGLLAAPLSPVLDASVYNPMIEYLCSHGLSAKAENFFRQLMKKGIDDKVAFNHLIRGHSREGKPESALEFLTIMGRRRIETESDAHELLVESFLTKGEPADAKAVLDNMIEQGHLPTSSLFRSVMEALLADGRVQTASRVMKVMIEKGVKENLDLVHIILESLFIRGHIEEALGRANLMLMHECAPDFDRLLTALCNKENVSAAAKLADFGLDRDCTISFSTYDMVLDALYSEGMTLRAYSILCKIKQKGQVVNKKGCDSLIKSLNAEGHTKQADILSRLLSGKAMSSSEMKNKNVGMHL